MNTSRRIEMDGQKNLRDLGGMVTADGRRIRENVLFRSDRLNTLSEKDIEKLISSSLCVSYDLRNTHEQTEQPDVDIPGCEHISLPVFPERVEGITHEKESQLQGYIRFVESMMENEGASRKRMAGSYRSFVNSDHCRKQFRFLLEDLLARERKAGETGEKKSYLWHCAGGKDRTGFAAAILEEIFGIPKEDIIEDYMLTNQYVNSDLTQISPQMYVMMKEHFGDRIEEIGEKIRGSVDDMILARREYIDAAYDEIEKLYGSFAVFLKEGLGFDEEKQEELRKLFLE